MTAAIADSRERSFSLLSGGYFCPAPATSTGYSSPIVLTCLDEARNDSETCNDSM